MPTIPTPFIGGADSPQRDTAKGKELARPYTPGSVELEAPVTPEVEPEPESAPWESVVGAENVDIDVKSVPVEAAAAEWQTEPEEPEPAKGPPAPAESLEPQEAEPAEPVLAEFKTVALTSMEPPLQPEGDETEAAGTGFEPIDAAEDQAEVATYSEEDEEAEDSEFPSFLFGPDATADEGPPEPVERASARPSFEAGETEETADRLTELGRELLTGEDGEEIRALIAALRPLTADIAVPRAFAAGYLAAKRRQEK